ncbi:ATP-binding protein [Photobacterium phosphoreum]|uniref:ATP-binding protein n=1 Tax=Photobacterium phosphoreum TaxID=659 RepID=UPI001E56C405|nr:ATP-binding protein [Photobacterium phosphoreum]
MKKFDLNIEKILENWDMHHAIREIIANALDEQFLSKTKEVEIFKENDIWYIRDFGRGLKYTHLTQNENDEKLNSTSVIGKFGIGLKDALATFYRRGAVITAKSKHNIIAIETASKEGFKDIVTLHALIDEKTSEGFLGTEFKLVGIKDHEMDNAKDLFLKFSNEEVIDTTTRGQVIKRCGDKGNIYINGVKVAEEDNFLFSYNITALTAPIKKALNRERTNVGRSAYTESIKKILLSSVKKEVAEILSEDLQNINLGTAHDELSWLDVQEHSVKILNQQGKVLFVTSFEAMQQPDMIDEAKRSGHNVVVIPDSLKHKISNSVDLNGEPIIDISQFVDNYNTSFEFDFVKKAEMTKVEKDIYEQTEKIVMLFGGMPSSVERIEISKTMRTDFFNEVETLGCWDSSSSSIVLSRKTLTSFAEYSGVLIHELIHAKTGFQDVTRDFETSLTNQIGKLCNELMNIKAPDLNILENKTQTQKKPWYKIW